MTKSRLSIALAFCALLAFGPRFTLRRLQLLAAFSQVLSVLVLSVLVLAVLVPSVLRSSSRPQSCKRHLPLLTRLQSCKRHPPCLMLQRSATPDVPVVDNWPALLLHRRLQDRHLVHTAVAACRVQPFHRDCPSYPSDRAATTLVR